MATSEEAAAAAAATLVEGDAAQETESGSEATTEEETVEFPDFNVEIPADLKALLEEDDTDLTVTDGELEALEAQHEDVPREVLARMLAAEKRADHLEKLRVTEARKNWEEEAEKVFPLAKPFLTEINATSKRGYMRTARDLHERSLPMWEAQVAKARTAQAAAKTAAEEEGKEEAKKKWGQAAESDEAPSEARVTLQATQGRRRRGEFSDTIREMLFPPKG